MDKFEFHPLANLFPLMTEAETNDLGEDMLKNTQLVPIKVYDGMILDGRNRYNACLLKDIEPRFDYLRHTTYETARDLVISLNLKRRHLDASQRGMMAAKLANMVVGRPSETATIGAISDGRAARLLNVSERSVERAKAVQRDGVPDLVNAVEQGEVSVSAAAQFAKQPKEDQAEQIAAAATPADAVKAANLAAVKAKDDRAKPEKASLADDDSDDDEQEGVEDRINGEDPENYRTAFLLRADQAAYFAAYSGPEKFIPSLLDPARKAAAAWTAIVERFESEAAAAAQRKAKRGGRRVAEIKAGQPEADA
jgi:hypothetical protein